MSVDQEIARRKLRFGAWWHINRVDESAALRSFIIERMSTMRVRELRLLSADAEALHGST